MIKEKLHSFKNYLQKGWVNLRSNPKDWLKRQWKKITVLVIGGSIALAAGIPPAPLGEHCIDFNGEEICFTYTDDNTGENMLIFSDKMTYGGWDKITFYLAIINNSRKNQMSDIEMTLPKGVEINNVSYLQEDVPYQVSVNEYGTTTYDCSYYEPAVSSSTKPAYIKKACIEDVITGSHKETRYRDEWQEVPFNINKIKNKVLIPKNLQLYLKVDLTVPPKTEGEFDVRITGDKGGVGHLK